MSYKRPQGYLTAIMNAKIILQDALKSLDEIQESVRERDLQLLEEAAQVCEKNTRKGFYQGHTCFKDSLEREGHQDALEDLYKKGALPTGNQMDYWRYELPLNYAPPFPRCKQTAASSNDCKKRFSQPLSIIYFKQGISREETPLLYSILRPEE